jgi:uncharacterized membrane protein YedE/YeeE
MIGLVQLFAVLTVGPLGVSTAYPQLVGVVLDGFRPGFAQEQPYLREIGASIGWEVMLVGGLLVGVLLSVALGRLRGQPAGETIVAAVAVRGFEGGRGWRYARAFAGGFLFIFGARLAGGCTTGHILSGTAQMALSGLVFGAAVFAAGYVVARLLYREPGAVEGR